MVVHLSCFSCPGCRCCPKKNAGTFAGVEIYFGSVKGTKRHFALLYYCSLQAGILPLPLFIQKAALEKPTNHSSGTYVSFGSCNNLLEQEKHSTFSYFIIPFHDSCSIPRTHLKQQEAPLGNVGHPQAAGKPGSPSGNEQIGPFTCFGGVHE